MRRRLHAVLAVAFALAPTAVAGCGGGGGGGWSGSSSATQNLVACLRGHGAQPHVVSLAHRPDDPFVRAGATDYVLAFGPGARWWKASTHRQDELITSGLTVQYYVFGTAGEARAVVRSGEFRSSSGSVTATATGPVVLVLIGVRAQARDTVAQARACADRA